MHLNLTCQKTHILAWLNLDNTLSLKINGVKYLGFPKIDKRGEKYWKCDGLVKDNLPNPSLPKKTLTLLESYQEKLKAGKPMSDFSKAEIDAYCQWEEAQKIQEQINQSQQVADQLSQKVANHETSSQ
jgi:hypothetical protein